MRIDKVLSWQVGDLDKERDTGWLWWAQEMKALTSVVPFNDISKKRNVLKWQGRQRNGGEPNTLFLRWGID